MRFVEHYKKCWKFLKESSWFVVFALALFCITFIVGFVYPQFFREEIIEWMRLMTSQIEGMSAVDITSFIFLNNLKASFFAIVGGVFLGVFPLIATGVNGYMAGFVSRNAADAESIFVLWRLFPHGIFEIPAVMISMGIGMKIGFDIFRSRNFKKNFVEAMRFFVFVIFPLLLIAGIIEGLLIYFF